MPKEIKGIKTEDGKVVIIY